LSEENRVYSTARQRRSIHPLGMRVVIAVRSDPNQTETGLYLPETSKDNLNESVIGEVIAVASALDSSSSDDDSREEVNISGIPLGSLVLVSRRSGVKVPWNENLRIVETKEVIAIIQEDEIL
jgi:co-chaperonin GroES (HSP10)